MVATVVKVMGPNSSDVAAARVTGAFDIVAHIYWRSPPNRLGCRMAKKQEVVDDLLDALVWMRRKAKKHEPVDDLIDALVRMRRKVKKKSVKRKPGKKRVKKRAKANR